MQICMFGSGSLGSAIGGILASRNEVVLIGRDPHMSAIRKSGLTLTGDVRRRVRLDARSMIGGLEPPELIILTAKAFDTGEVVDTCRLWAGRQTRILTLQNGLGNLESIRAWKGRAAFGGTTTLGARLMSPGRVRVCGLGRTVIGSDIDSGFARKLAREFTSCGLPAEVVENIHEEIWSKAVVSACINPLTAILRIPNGALRESECLVKIVSETVRECVRAARAEGVPLSRACIEERVWTVVRDTSGNRSSMLCDVQRGRRTEVRQINGAFLRAAAAHGISLPVNRSLTAMVEALAKT